MLLLFFFFQKPVDNRYISCVEERELFEATEIRILNF